MSRFHSHIVPSFARKLELEKKPLVVMDGGSICDGFLFVQHDIPVSIDMSHGFYRYSLFKIPILKSHSKSTCFSDAPDNPWTRDIVVEMGSDALSKSDKTARIAIYPYSLVPQYHKQVYSHRLILDNAIILS